MAKLRTASQLLLLLGALSVAAGTHPRKFRVGFRKGTSRSAFQLYLPTWWAHSKRNWEPASSTASDLSDRPVIEIPFYAQSQQDRHAVENYFFGKKHLFYLEMGGMDGVALSNTLYLQKAMGWRGLLIEPNPSMYFRMINNRPDDIGVNAATCDRFQNVHFIDAPSVGGIVEYMPDAFKQQFGHVHATASTTVIPCLPLSSILSKLGITHIDFWSLDVEEAELKVLQTFDWKATTVDVLVVEANGHNDEKDQAVIDLLVEQGFVYDGRIVVDNWFHHQTFMPSAGYLTQYEDVNLGRGVYQNADPYEVAEPIHQDASLTQGTEAYQDFVRRSGTGSLY